MRVQPEDDHWTCEVRVVVGDSTTEHTVTVSAADLERWGDGSSSADVERLVMRSFKFLLVREPAGSILKTFQLSVIPRYFSEFDSIIRNH